jgi:membrane peptidoglycan carboxypeptidase
VTFVQRLGRGLLKLSGRVFGLGITMSVAVVAITACLSVLGDGLTGIGSSLEVTPPKRPAFRELKERSVVFDGAGRQIAVFKSEENRRAVPLERVPQHLIHAILDVEDANFYVHKGFNAKSTSRAMLQNLSSGEVEQGGSTITQQLVKIDLLTRAQKLDRKVREARFAMQLEKELTKNEILERYLNSVYFGGGAYGVEAAANHYFSKSVSALDVPESAFIAGMIRNPTGYDPVRFRDRSRRRRSTVLGRMVAVGHLTKTDAERYDNAPMPFPEKEQVVEKPSSYSRRPEAGRHRRRTVPGCVQWRAAHLYNLQPHAASGCRRSCCRRHPRKGKGRVHRFVGQYRCENRSSSSNGGGAWF